MTRRTKRLLNRILPYIIVAICALAVIAAALIIPKRDQAGTAAAGNASGSAGESASSETESARDLPTVEVGEESNICALIAQYYQARIDDDADSLNSIVDADESYSAEELESQSKYIEKFDDFETCVVPGVTDDYFIVYVKYNIYFNNIPTGAPALNRYIICKDADGHYYIYDREVSDEFATYIEETENSETVQNLRKKVEEELAAACEQDPDLKTLIDTLNGTAVESTDASETDSTAAESSETESTQDSSQSASDEAL